MKSCFYYLILLHTLILYSQEGNIIKTDNYLKFKGALNSYVQLSQDKQQEVAQSLLDASLVLTQDDVYNNQEGHFGLLELLQTRHKSEISESVITHVMKLTPPDTFLDTRQRVFENGQQIWYEMMHDSLPLPVAQHFANHLMRSEIFTDLQNGHHFRFLSNLTASFYDYRYLEGNLPQELIERELPPAKEAFFKEILHDATVKSGNCLHFLTSLLLYNNLFLPSNRGRCLVEQQLVQLLAAQDQKIPSFLKKSAILEHSR